MRVAAQRNHYDGPDYLGLPVGQVDKGYLTRAEVWLDRKDHLVSPQAAVDDQFGGSWLTAQSMRLDAQGHVLETRDANGNRAMLQYDDVLARAAHR